MYSSENKAGSKTVCMCSITPAIIKNIYMYQKTIMVTLFLDNLALFLYFLKFSALNMHSFFSKNTHTVNVTKTILRKVTKIVSTGRERVWLLIDLTQ